MKILLLAQLLAPILLVAWLVLRPAGSAVGLAAQLLGSMAALAGVAVTGLWLFPPWWVPRAGLIAVALAGAWAWFRRRRSGVLPHGVVGWTGVLFFAVLALVGAYAVARGRVASRLPDPDAVVDLAFPLEAGRYLVVNGGAWETINAHRASMNPNIARLRPWRGNGHAVDLVAIDAFGSRAPGLLPQDPALYQIYDVGVLAPCSGRVVFAVDGRQDMPVPRQDLEHMAGNHVILDCAGVHVVLAHFRSGSVLVEVGQELAEGEPIARVGNSGMSSEPHLHVHAQRPGPPDAPMSGDPLPMRLGGRYLVRGDRVRVE